VASYVLEAAPEVREQAAPVTSRRAAWISVALVAVIGITALPMPYTGDQALFGLGAQALAHGRSLYTGFWDTKQPAVFWFFRAAGGVFGYRQVGAHMFELVWQLALALLVVRVVRGRFHARWIEGTAALMSVGAYYLIASPDVMTQVEALVGLPLLAAIWLFHEAGRALTKRESRRLTAAAFCLFVVVMFKLILVVVPLAACLAIARVRSDSRPKARALLRALLLGFVAPATTYLVWVAAHGALGELVHTWFFFPSGMPQRAGRSAARLFDSVELFAKLFAPIIVLAAIGARRALARRNDTIAQSMLAWIAVGVPVFLVQMWWFYLLLLFIVPLGILAAFGIDTLWSSRARFGPVARSVAIVVLVASSAWMLHRYAQRMEKLASHRFAIGSSNTERFRFAESPHYAQISRLSRHLTTVPADDAVFVWGDPLYLYLRGRDQPVAVNGWAAEALDRHEWKRSAEELAATKPAVIFVDTGSAPYIEQRGHGVSKILSEEYAPAARSADGVWYQLKTDR
jgi:hypothetical protein